MQLKAYLNTGLALITLMRQVFVGEVVRVELPNGTNITVRIDHFDGSVAVGYNHRLKVVRATKVIPFPQDEEETSFTAFKQRRLSKDEIHDI